MIPNQWYAILESRDLGGERPVGVVRMGEQLVLWRSGDGQVICMEDRCPHRGVALSKGNVRDGVLACGYHGMRFDTAGKCVRIPCAGEGAKIPSSLSVKTRHVIEQHGLVWLWWGEPRTSYPDVPWIKEIPTDPRETLSRTEVWPFNYARLCENHLDAHHWAYVHDNIMVGVGEHFAEFEVEVSEDETLIETWGTLKRGTGPDAARQKGWDFKCHFRFPNLSMIQVTPYYRSFVIQTPMDEHTSWIVVKTYQTYSRLPLVRGAIDRYCQSFLFSVPLHRQDFPLFFAQRPTHTGVGVNKLVAADAGIAQYLRIRDKLIKQARQSAPATVAAHEPVAIPVNGAVAKAPVIVPEHLRNMDRWRYAQPGYHPSWVRMYLSYPLLVPSLIGSKLLSLRHRP